jgi:hypothetical protein
MDLSNLSQEDIDSIKNQLAQIEPGTEGTVKVGSGDSEFRVYMPKEVNYDTGIQIAGRGGGGVSDCNEVFDHVIDEQSNTIILSPIHLGNTDDWMTKGLDVIDCIKDSNPCIADTTVVYQGYSASFGNTIHSVAANCTERGYNFIPVLMEPRDIYNNVELTQEEINNLIKTNTPLVYFDTNPDVFNGDVFKRAQSDISEFAKQGLTVYYIEYTAQKDNGDSHGFVRTINAESELWGLSNGTFDILGLPTEITHDGKEYQMSYKLYKFDENGERVLITDPHEQRMAFCEIMYGNNTIFDLSDVTRMSNYYIKQSISYGKNIKLSISSINDIMDEFLSTDAGFLADKINSIISVINNTKIRDLVIANDYVSTTSSPKIQDIKMLEYKVNTLQILDNVLSFTKQAMDAQLKIQETERDINNEAANLGGTEASDFSELTGALAGLPFTIDPTLSDEERASELERLTDLTYENLYGEDARNAASEKGLTGSEADEYVNNYLDAVRENYENIMSNTDVNANVESSTVTETSVGDN